MGKEFSTIVEAIEDVRQGKMIVIVDDEDRENEGDLMIAAEKATPELINFMARFGRGLICLTLTEERTKELGLSMMVEDNQSAFETPFTVSIDARQGVSTGISAADRAHTIKVAIDSLTVKEDLVKPGHIFPLRAKDGGVLVRMGQTEASVDIARIAGLNPYGVICEIMNEDGTMDSIDRSSNRQRATGWRVLPGLQTGTAGCADGCAAGICTDRRVRPGGHRLAVPSRAAQPRSATLDWSDTPVLVRSIGRSVEHISTGSVVADGGIGAGIADGRPAPAGPPTGPARSVTRGPGHATHSGLSDRRGGHAGPMALPFEPAVYRRFPVGRCGHICLACLA